MAKFPRCTVCPRCGSGSFRRIRPEAVLPIRRVRECRRCQQQYRGPLPAPVCVLLVIVGLGMAGWLAFEIKRAGVEKAMKLTEPVALAAAGAAVFLVGAFTLIFQRGQRPPERKPAHTNPGETTANAWKPEAGTNSPPQAAPHAKPVAAGVFGAGAGPALTEAPLLPRSAKVASPTPTPVAVIRPSPTPTPVLFNTTRTATPAPIIPNPTRSSAPFPMPSDAALKELRRGVVIPAHPLALNPHREYDEHRTRMLTRYYLASGAGGIAAAVHTTQFDIRKPKHNLLRRVLENIAQEITQHEQRAGKTIVKVAGICGDTIRAGAEAQLATELGYDAGLLNLADLPKDASDFDLLEHCKEIARIMPIFGFYLNPAVGGRELSFGFWRALAEIPNVVAIKIAAFDRYHTLDVMRAVAEAGRALRPASAPQQVQAENPIAIYTGNDDHIIGDLLGEWTFDVAGKPVTQRIVGGLLGHWAVWTRCAVETLASIQRVNQGAAVPREALLLDRQVTDMNAAIFDAANHYRGCLPGILEVLRRQGLVESALCLDPDLSLSPGQAEEITRVIKAYPHLTDDAFVAQHRAQWVTW